MKKPETNFEDPRRRLVFEFTETVSKMTDPREIQKYLLDYIRSNVPTVSEHHFYNEQQQELVKALITIAIWRLGKLGYVNGDDVERGFDSLNNKKVN
ncbi:MAG: hypothetical protein NTX98_02415 [Candidatus Doudnabacteria bacterium]|nr:hypothetical protein [Candidatus Doudnabacteria bacterium]